MEMLRLFIEQRPTDPFPRYALALEHKNLGDPHAAWTQFETLLQRHADYTPAYLHAGNTLVALGRIDQARTVFRTGVQACERTGDAHARGEIEQALFALD